MTPDYPPQLASLVLGLERTSDGKPLTPSLATFDLSLCLATPVRVGTDGSGQGPETQAH